MQKGQIEVVTLLGIAVLVIVVVLLAFQSGDVSGPTNVQQLQKRVDDSITNMLEKGAEATLREMELRGGYLEGDAPPGGTVRFVGTDVAVWQACENDFAPTVEELQDTMARGIASYFNTNKASLLDSLKSTNVSIGSPGVAVNIVDNMIDVKASMRVSLRGAATRREYKTAVKTNFKQMHEFASKYTEVATGERFLEVFTVLSLHVSELPVAGVMTECGERLSESPAAVKRKLENVIAYTLSRIIWWKPTEKTTKEPFTYHIEDLMGEQFTRLDIGFFLPDDFRILNANRVDLRNNKDILPGPESMPGFPSVLKKRLNNIRPRLCVNSYEVEYDVSFPAILRVGDALTGHSLNFATQAKIKDNLKGACGAFTPVPPEDTCENLACRADIMVTGKGDLPIKGASVFFGACEVGVTNEGGRVVAPILCGDHEFSVIPQGTDYPPLDRNIHSDSINGTYRLHKYANITVNFRGVRIKQYGPGIPGDDIFDSTCDASESSCPLPSPSPILSGPACGFGPIPPAVTECIVGNITDAFATVTFTDKDNEENTFSVTNVDYDRIPDNCTLVESEDGDDDCLKAGVIDRVSADHIPGGEYKAGAEILKPENQVKFMGGFTGESYRVPEANNTVYAYIPRVVPPANDMLLGDNADDLLAAQFSCMTEFMKSECKIDPFGTGEHFRRTYRLDDSCENLKYLAEAVVCFTGNEIDDMFDEDRSLGAARIECDQGKVKDAFLDKCEIRVIDR
ncbi:MAG: hypothetical protein HY518_04410 [Candidatus Aenigmarchaeota archaeon]|nr:hypothetical protein [Candidatus Aenigmarchaeota archaeon]